MIFVCRAKKYKMEFLQKCQALKFKRKETEKKKQTKKMSIMSIGTSATPVCAGMGCQVEEPGLQSPDGHATSAEEGTITLRQKTGV